MTSPKKSKRRDKKAALEVELKPDAWQRFERFIRDVAKAGPKHRKANGKSAPPKSHGQSAVHENTRRKGGKGKRTRSK